jgi:hypothetical protein
MSGYVPVNWLDMHYEIHGTGSPPALYRPDGLYPEMITEPESGADDLTGSVWHQAHLQWRRIPAQNDITRPSPRTVAN